MYGTLFADALTEIRTPVLSLKGLRPSPLDDEGNGWNSISRRGVGQVLYLLLIFCLFTAWLILCQRPIKDVFSSAPFFPQGDGTTGNQQNEHRH